MDIRAETLTITQLARKLGLSRPYVSRNYRKWGFKTLPQFVKPRVLVADAERYLAGTLKPDAAPLPHDEAYRLAQEAADYSDRGLDWPPR